GGWCVTHAVAAGRSCPLRPLLAGPLRAPATATGSCGADAFGHSVRLEYGREITISGRRMWSANRRVGPECGARPWLPPVSRGMGPRFAPGKASDHPLNKVAGAATGRPVGPPERSGSIPHRVAAKER